LIILCEVAVDGGLEVDDAAEYAALELTLGEDHEKALDGVVPGGGCRGEVEGEARVARQSLEDLRMLVGGVVVEDDMDDLADRNLCFDLVEKADEFLMPLLLHALPDHRRIEHVKRGEEGGRPVTVVVVGHCPAAPPFQRQARLDPVQRLDLGFLVEGQHHRMGRPIGIKPHDIAKLLGKPLVVRQFELTGTMRLKTVLAPDALHRRDADTGHLGQRRSRPMDGFARRLFQGPSNNRTGDFRPQWRNARRACLVGQEPVHAFIHKPFLPAPDRVLGNAPACHSISFVPTESAVRRMIRARQTCFRGLFRSAAIASKRALKAVAESMVI